MDCAGRRALFDGGAGAGLLPRLAAERLERGPRRAGALEDVLLLLRELLGALAPLEDVFLAGGASKVLLKEICSYCEHAVACFVELCGAEMRRK